MNDDEDLGIVEFSRATLLEELDIEQYALRRVIRHIFCLEKELEQFELLKYNKVRRLRDLNVMLEDVVKNETEDIEGS